MTVDGCDLLSNCIFSAFYHIWEDENLQPKQVVICFQIVSLVRSITSLPVKPLHLIRL